jgi:hypothetical protein
MLMPYMITKIGSSVTKLLKVLIIYLTQMDGRQKTNQMRFTEELRELYTEFEEEQFSLTI